MKLELRRTVDGTGFVICVCGEKSRKQIVIPLAGQLSAEVATMLELEGVSPLLRVN